MVESRACLRAQGSIEVVSRHGTVTIMVGSRATGTPVSELRDLSSWPFLVICPEVLFGRQYLMLLKNLLCLTSLKFSSYVLQNRGILLQGFQSGAEEA